MPHPWTTFIVILRLGYLLCFLSVLPGVASGQTCVQPPAGLVSWWPGEGDAMDIADDNHGTLQGGATFAQGMVGQAFSFDSIDDFVEAPHNTNLNLQQALTIEAWVMKQGSCGNNCWIVMKQNDTMSPCSESFRYGLFIFGWGGGAPGSAALSFNTGEWDDVVVSQTVLQDQVWYHVAGTYDGNTAKIYVNGVLDHSVPKTGPILASTAGPLFIGQNQCIGSVEFFNGLIDEVAIYNRALSAEEVAAIFQAGSAGKCKEGAGGVGGSVTGLQPALIVCENLSTQQTVVIWEQQTSWNCETAGLEVTPDDLIRITIVGGAQ